MVKVFTLMAELNLFGQYGKFFCHFGFKVCLCYVIVLVLSTSYLPYILGIIQINCYFLCWLLIGYSKLKSLWSNDLPSLSEGFLNGSLL